MRFFLIEEFSSLDCFPLELAISIPGPPSPYIPTPLLPLKHPFPLDPDTLGGVINKAVANPPLPLLALPFKEVLLHGLSLFLGFESLPGITGGFYLSLLLKRPWAGG